MKNLKQLLLFASCFCSLASFASAKDTLTVQSPDGNVKMKVWIGKTLSYSVNYKEKAVTGVSSIDLIPLNKKALSDKAKIVSTQVKTVNSVIQVPVSERRKVIQDNYTELIVKFSQPYTVTFRAYNDGVAYRITTSFKDSIYVKNEVANFSFVNNPSVYYPLIHKKSNADIFHTSFEELYPQLPVNEIRDTAYAFNPVLVAPTDRPKVAITESDLRDYPGMFLRGTSSDVLEGVFAPFGCGFPPFPGLSIEVRNR